MDMDKPRAFVEHPKHGSKMIYLEEREGYLKNGWHKPGEEPDVEVKEEDPEEKSVGSMTKDDMRKFVKENKLDVVITGKMSEHTARKKIEKALHDNSVENH